MKVLSTSFNLAAAIAGLWLSLAFGGLVAVFCVPVALAAALALVRAGRTPALVAAALLLFALPGGVQAEWHFGLGLFGNRQPKVVTLQAVVPTTASCAACVAPAAVAVPQPVTVQMQLVQPAPVAMQMVPAAPVVAAPAQQQAPIMLNVAPAVQPDRYYLLRIDGQGNASIAPCNPKQ